MFITLSKLLPPFLYPLGLACSLLVLTLWLRRRGRGQSWLIVAALALLWLGSSPLVTTALLRPLEWEFLPPTDPAVLKADMIVVLGGGTRSQKFPRPTAELNNAGSRMLYAAYLYRQGAAPRILLSGGNLPWSDPQLKPEAETMADVLEIMGVPREALILEGRSRNTYENAVNSRAILVAEGIDRIILVTSAMHMPRAYRLFHKQGLTIIPAPTDYIVTEGERPTDIGSVLTATAIGLLPDSDNLAWTTRALKEYMGLVVYRLRGWL